MYMCMYMYLLAYTSKIARKAYNIILILLVFAVNAKAYPKDIKERYS